MDCTYHVRCFRDISLNVHTNTFGETTNSRLFAKSEAVDFGIKMHKLINAYIYVLLILYNTYPEFI